MTADQIVLLLEALHVKKIRVKDNGWVEASCPLAPWRHKHSVDSTPSFGVKINDGGRSAFSCFGCIKGSVEDLVMTLELYTKDTPGLFNLKLCHQLLDEELKVMPLPEYGGVQSQEQPFEEWPSYWIDTFEPAKNYAVVGQYWDRREATEADWVVATQHDIRFDPKRQMIVCPYWNVWGKFAGARGRSVVENTSGAAKHFDYSFNGRNNAKLVWYNEQVLNLDGPVVVVEGQHDCWRTLQAHPKTVANLTARPSWERMKKLSYSGVVIQIPDRDVAGEQSVEVYADWCKKIGVHHRVVWLDEGVKDPAEAHPEYLRDRIASYL